MSKTILVTGSAGFIGFHVSRALLDRGDVVIGMDNFNNYYDPALKEARNKILEQNANYKLYRADIRNQDELKQIFSNPNCHSCDLSAEALAKEESGNPLKIDAICHLAAQAGVRYSLDHPQEYVRTNIEGSVNVFEAARETGIKNIVYASSSSVYGNNEIPWSETQDVGKPINPYGATKQALERMAYAYHHLYGLNMTGLRFFTVYGPWGRPDMAYFKFADKIARREPIDVYNNGQMRRDFTYIDDIVAGVVAAVENPKPYEIYNLGNSHSEELGKLIELLETGLGKRAQKNFLPMQPGEFLENFADIAKAKRDLEFAPKTAIEEGLKKFVQWYEEYYYR